MEQRCATLCTGAEQRSHTAGSGGALKRGDHGETLPSYQSVQTPTTTIITHATAHGLRRKLRSPLLKKKGSANMEPNTMAGARIMMPD